jgi:two-component system chemotaxis sensor kinase CheA
MTLEGSPFITHMKEPLALLSLSSLLGNEAASWELEGSGLPVVVVNSGGKHCALGVDGLLAEREALIHELTGPAARVPYFSGAIHLGHGDIALVLNPAQLVGQSGNKSSQLPVAASTMAIEEQTPEILVVDDSFTTRTLEKSILEAHGYKVHIAVDGVEGLSLLRSQNVDLVIADVEMPRMTGFELLENVRTDTRLQRLPFILVTSRDKVEDRENGLNLGANAYIVKQKFDHENLLDTIQQML